MSLLLRLVDRTKVKNGFLEAIYLNRGHTKTVSVTIPVFRNKRNVDFHASFSKRPQLRKMHSLLSKSSIDQTNKRMLESQ